MEKSRKALFLYLEVYDGAQKIHKKFTIKSLVLIVKKMMLENRPTRFNLLKCQ